MKKFSACVLAAIMLATMITAYGATEDELIIDLTTATNEELRSTIEIIQDELTERYKQELDEQDIERDVNGITFRDVPWYSTLKDTETIIGPGGMYATDHLKRLSYTDYSGFVAAEDIAWGEIGCIKYYKNLSVAGYVPSNTQVCYIFPLVDGMILRDYDLAQIYMGDYEFRSGDFGDVSGIYDDFKLKLTNLYGDYEQYTDGKFVNDYWQDDQGNIVRLRASTDGTYVTLGYTASGADRKLDEIEAAYTREQEQNTEQIRQQNVNNTDGL